MDFDFIGPRVSRKGVQRVSARNRAIAAARVWGRRVAVGVLVLFVPFGIVVVAAFCVAQRVEDAAEFRRGEVFGDER